jgi:hypothetical protein
VFTDPYAPPDRQPRSSEPTFVTHRGRRIHCDDLESISQNPGEVTRTRPDVDHGTRRCVRQDAPEGLPFEFVDE